MLNQNGVCTAPILPANFLLELNNNNNSYIDTVNNVINKELTDKLVNENCDNKVEKAREDDSLSTGIFKASLVYPYLEDEQVEIQDGRPQSLVFKFGGHSPINTDIRNFVFNKDSSDSVSNLNVGHFNLNEDGAKNNSIKDVRHSLPPKPVDKSSPIHKSTFSINGTEFKGMFYDFNLISSVFVGFSSF